MKPTKKKTRDKNDWINILPLILIVLIVPLIVYMKVSPVENEYLKYYWSSSPLIDMFTYYKSIWLVILSLIGIILYFTKINRDHTPIKKTRYYVFMVIYTILVILSSILSSNNSIAFFGIVGRYEGMFVLIAYMVIMFLAINLLNDEKSAKYILYAIFVSTVIIGIIGLNQYFGIDYLKTDLFKKIVTPMKYQSMNVNLPYASGEIYSTLAHNNYVGSYMSMLFPLTVVLFLFERNKYYKIGLGIISLLTFSLLIGSHSRAGFLGALFAVFLGIIMMRKTILNNLKNAVYGIVALSIIFVCMNIAGGGIISDYARFLFRDIAKTAVLNNNSTSLKDINIDKNIVNIIYPDKQLKIILDGNNLVFKDESDKDVNIKSQENKINFLDERFKNITMESSANNGVSLLHVKINDSRIILAVLKDGFKFVTHKGELVDLKPVKKWGFESKEDLGSARGYIWSRSIPLLKNTVILGYGPDTFPINFPQDDYIGKFINYGVINMFVDKPHNLYLNIALSTGIISLLAILIIFGMYLVTSIKIYLMSSFESFNSKVGLAVFTGFCGYLVSGFFNDSVVTVAPVFWILFGMGISINAQLANSVKEDKKSI